MRIKKEIKLQVKMAKTDDLKVNKLMARCETGKHFGRAYVYGDISIYRPGVTNSLQHINSQVLRDALLYDKEMVAEYLGIQVIDLLEEETTPPVEEEVNHEEPVGEEPKKFNEDNYDVDEAMDPQPSEEKEETSEEEANTEEPVVEPTEPDHVEEKPAEEVEAPADEEAIEAVPEDGPMYRLDDIKELTNKELRGMLEAEGIQINPRANKTAILEAFKENNLV